MNRRRWSVVSAFALSWLGLWFHELIRVPRWWGFTLDGDLFMLAIAIILVAWWLRSRSRVAASVAAVYAAINLLGAAVTILPFSWLPFRPEQTFAHYVAHFVYGGAQLPLFTLGLLRAAATHGEGR